MSYTLDYTLSLLILLLYFEIVVREKITIIKQRYIVDSTYQ